MTQIYVSLSNLAFTFFFIKGFKPRGRHSERLPTRPRNAEVIQTTKQQNLLVNCRKRSDDESTAEALRKEERTISTQESGTTCRKPWQKMGTFNIRWLGLCFIYITSLLISFPELILMPCIKYHITKLK